MIACSFCGKTQKEVARLVTGSTPTGELILCDECLVVSFAQMIESPIKFAEGAEPDTALESKAHTAAERADEVKVRIERTRPFAVVGFQELLCSFMRHSNMISPHDVEGMIWQAWAMASKANQKEEEILEEYPQRAVGPNEPLVERDTSMDDAKWYASGGDLGRAGPFPTQKQAWLAMRLTAEARAKEECPYPKDTIVWPEWD